MHPKFLGGNPPNPYAVLGLDALAPYLGVTEASRGLISQGGGYLLGAAPFNPALGPVHPAYHPSFHAQAGLHPLSGLHPQLAQNPLLQQMIQRQAAAHFPQMTAHTPARKSGNSLGVNVEIGFNNGTFGSTTGGYTIANFPATGVAGSATQTLQSEFHGLKLSASAIFSGYYTPSGGGANVLVYGAQSGGLASDVLLQGVFVGGYNAQPLPPGTGITDGGVSLSAYPPNGLGNGIDMLPGKIGQVVKCPLLVQASLIPLFTVPAGATLNITAARIFLTFFGDNLQ